MNIATFKDLTRFEQTLFGLPLILAGALLPLIHPDIPFTLRFLWIFPPFLLARISGMAFNQLIDAQFDAQNPRTQNRAIPEGRATDKQAHTIAWGSLVLFLLTTSQLNSLCFFLAFAAASLIYIYSYLKRFTVACHFVLGGIHFFGPVMAAAAISGSLSKGALCLGLAAASTITGNDIVYALQDEAFDRKARLFSLPAKFGRDKSLLISRSLHLFTLFSLLVLGLIAHLPIFYYLLIPVCGRIFWQFHTQKEPEVHFFSCNVRIALSILGFIIGSVIWDVM